MFDTPDRVELVKPDGRRIKDIPASVQPKMIFIDDAQLPIEEGDKLVRRLSNGLSETYIVLDRGFYEAEGSFNAHYQIKVRKETAIVDAPRQVVYNVSGANARVNVNSHDASVNVVNTTSDQLLQELRKVIVAGVKDRARRSEILSKVDDLEDAADQPAFLTAYQAFISAAADHMTLFAPFIPALTQMLQ